MMQLMIRRALDPADRDACMALRMAVFVDEQSVPAEYERDEYEAVALHFLATDWDIPVGTARVLLRDDGRTAKIGRVAVSRLVRGQGVGAAIMRAVEADPALAAVTELRLDAQCHAIAFYERLGYSAFGPDFMDAGIPHRTMRKTPAIG